jgi:Domain of unknown function (DUF4082)
MLRPASCPKLRPTATLRRARRETLPNELMTEKSTDQAAEKPDCKEVLVWVDPSNKRKRLLALLFLLAATVPWKLAPGATIRAASANLSDVKAAYNQAAPGDTVVIPPGIASWSGGITISKSVTIQGAGPTGSTEGSGSTTINKSGAFTVFEISGLPVDVPVRISGLRINASTIGQNGTDSAIVCNGPLSYPGNTKIRIDNCYFKGGQQVIFWNYEIVGVVDHCTFLDCAYAQQTYGMADLDWNRYSAPNPAYPMGSLDAVYYEDDSFIWDGQTAYTDTMSDAFEGGRVVFRHCTFDSTGMSAYMNAFVVQHGNENLWKGSADYLRGPIALEFYNNTCKIGSSYRVIWVRGGRFLIANNTFTVLNSGIGLMVALSEEECWQSRGPEGAGAFPSVRPTSDWPAEDMANGFIFGNTINGQPQTDSVIGGWDPGDSIIQKNRDWWDRAPSSSTNITYPNPPSPSSANYPNPYNPNVTAWTGAQYPHPLTVADPQPRPTPTATPAPTPTPTPGPTPTPTPAPKPTATPTPGPTPVPIPTPTPTPSPSPSPTATPTPTPKPYILSTFFKCDDIPAYSDSGGDIASVELGMKFTSSVQGYVVAIKFWKDPQSTGSHIGNLWDANGNLIESVLFTCESASGWQTAVVPVPVAITAGQTYTVSYHTSGYPNTGSYFTALRTNAPISTLANAGVFAYSSASLFPTQTWNSNNYFVDVVLSHQ